MQLEGVFEDEVEDALFQQLAIALAFLHLGGTAGGVTDTAVLGELAAAGVGAVILGEALLNGSLDFGAALAVARGVTNGGVAA